MLQGLIVLIMRSLQVIENFQITLHQHSAQLKVKNDIDGDSVLYIVLTQQYGPIYSR